jgi:hypothetical protein
MVGARKGLPGMAPKGEGAHDDARRHGNDEKAEREKARENPHPTTGASTGQARGQRHYPNLTLKRPAYLARRP